MAELDHNGLLVNFLQHGPKILLRNLFIYLFQLY